MTESQIDNDLGGKMARKTPCECCGTLFWKKDMVFGPNPFNEDVHDDPTPEWLCGECREMLWWEI